MKERSRVPVPVILAALFVFVFTNLFSLLVFDHVPRIHDEISYVFQAEIFHSGRLTVPSPCPPRAFDFTHVINNGRWYGMYPPGFPLLLAAGMAIGAPWIVNPLLAALFITNGGGPSRIVPTGPSSSTTSRASRKRLGPGSPAALFSV